MWMGFREPHMSGDSGIATTTLGDTRLSIRQDIRDVFTRIQVTVKLFTKSFIHVQIRYIKLFPVTLYLQQE
jgi:hypothetical protein